MSVKCRDAVAADRGRIVDLLSLQLVEHSLSPPRAALEAAVARLVGEPELGRILVADAAGEIVGVAVTSSAFSLEHGGRAAWLDELYVIPERRNRGIGAALLEAACAAAAARGARAIDLEVEAGHERAASLYERRGFTRHERQRWFLRLPLRVAPPAALATAGVPMDGGCLCGAVRYRITTVAEDVSHCHCTLCRRSTGAPFVTWLTVSGSAFAFTQGRPAARRSTSRAERTFCATCGTALTFREEDRPNAVDVTAASLDRPEEVVPRDHTFVASRLPWVKLDDGLPQFADVNPAERDVPSAERRRRDP